MNNQEPIRSQAAEIKSQFLQLTKNMEKRLFVCMNKDVIPKIASGAFAYPTKPLSGGPVKRQRKLSESTNLPSHDSHSQVSRRVEENNPSKGFTHKKQVAGDKKFKTIISMLLNFEENCIVSRVAENKTLQKLRRYNRKYLSYVCQESDEVRSQHSDSLGLAILLQSAIKIGMSKKDFIANAQPVAKRKNLDVSFIRKSKCYGIVKQLITNNK